MSAFVVSVSGKFERVVERLDYRYDTKTEAKETAKRIVDEDAA